MESYANISLDAMEKNKLGEAQPIERESKFDSKNYLNVRLDKKAGEKQKKLRIRLLPMDLTTGNPFLQIHQHNVQVPTEVAESGFKSYICLTKSPIDHSIYGSKCPFCEINQTAYREAQKETDPLKKKQLTQLSLANRAREGVIVRCIDRDHEDEGVKFWKFNLSLKEDDPYHQIYNLAMQRKAEGEAAGQKINILDINEGYDLIVTISEGGENTKGNTITISDAKFASPLSKDPEQTRAWINDPKKWSDVFGIKSYDYLSLISIGEIPWFDRETKSWVSKKDFEGANNRQKQTYNDAIANADAEFRNGASRGSNDDFTDSLMVELPNNNETEDLPF